MIKKPITYQAIQFDDNDEAVKVSRTENFYFNLTQAEALEINLMEDLESVGNSKDPKAIIPVFKRIIQYAYGVKLPNGKFTKDPAQTTDFLSSDAYSELFLELLKDGEAGVATFIRRVCDFDVSDVPMTNATQAKAPAQPQDYKKSAREIAAEQKETAVKDAAENHRVTEDSTPQTPADAHRVASSSGSKEDDAEYQEFLRYKASQQEQAKQQNTTPSPAVEVSAEEPVSQPPFEAQQLRRDQR